MRHYLDFEKPIAELEGKIEELRRMSEPGGINIADEVARLTSVADRQLRAAYARLTPGSKVVVSGNLDRAEVWSAELYEHIAAAGRGEIAGGQE